MWLTARTFLQMHATFCEYLVFHEFRRNLYIALAKYIKQEGIADLLFSKFFLHLYIDNYIVHLISNIQAVS